MIKLSNAEIEAVSALPRADRVAHFVKRVVDSQQIWGVRDQGWVLSGSRDGQEVFQVWPFAEYPKRCCVGEWASCTPASIALDEFVDSYLPDLAEKGIALGVFYTPVDNGVLMSGGELAELLRHEEDEWY